MAEKSVEALRLFGTTAVIWRQRKTLPEMRLRQRTLRDFINRFDQATFTRIKGLKPTGSEGPGAQKNARLCSTTVAVGANFGPSRRVSPIWRVVLGEALWTSLKILLEDRVVDDGEPVCDATEEIWP